MIDLVSYLGLVNVVLQDTLYVIKTTQLNIKQRLYYNSRRISLPVNYTI